MSNVPESLQAPAPDLVRGRSKRFQACVAVSISIAWRTMAMTSSGCSSIMVQVNRSTNQPSRTRRFCRRRSVGSSPWSALPALSGDSAGSAER